ncbi:sulfite exporter TauE/SafE family protein [Pseudonocardia acidicola]|uniref:Probable membrane transporter protein n=1 Tax=Pseudonocardia acidicola TaxID=2724939 RepID=A0ABX1SCP1_9PSEU|nr:sulfite exporter TauE/SafE family protein [Pseudonocardia acidicola]NMH98654.1 sulfite exporter TauE/SafE family protein [Pseudonocardia acidicola]
MTPWQALLVALAGMAAGAVNAAVGSGTLITFPVLLAVGYPPLLANVSNNIGLVPGSVAGVFGYRRELRGQRARVLRLCAASAVGGLVGAGVLLLLPAQTFAAVVPVLIGVAVLLVLVQPLLARRLAARRAETPRGGDSPWLTAGVTASGVYGGYFGAAQGVILLGLMGVALPEDLQRINALKNAMALTVNLAAGIVFALLADQIAWTAALLIAAGATVGGRVGAALSRRLPPMAFRLLIAAVGVAAMANLLLR